MPPYDAIKEPCIVTVAELKPKVGLEPFVTAWEFSGLQIIK